MALPGVFTAEVLGYEGVLVLPPCGRCGLSSPVLKIGRLRLTLQMLGDMLDEFGTLRRRYRRYGLSKHAIPCSCQYHSDLVGGDAGLAPACDQGGYFLLQGYGQGTVIWWRVVAMGIHGPDSSAKGRGDCTRARRFILAALHTAHCTGLV
jgi:hypothetical protein